MHLLKKFEDRRQIAAIREFMERNPDISYVEYESNPVLRMDLVITTSLLPGEA